MDWLLLILANITDSRIGSVQAGYLNDMVWLPEGEVTSASTGNYIL